MSALQKVITWTETTRSHALLLNNDANALLTRLLALRHREQAVQHARTRPLTIGLYGHSQEAKAHLLTTLCDSPSGHLSIHVGVKTLDWFTHINPGHGVTRMALRFSPHAAPPDDAFPLRLTLLSEAELVQLFIAQAQTQTEIRPVSKSAIVARIATWQSLRQPQQVPGITREEVAAIARFWQEAVPTSRQQMDDDLWFQFAQLIPSLDLSARASAWSLLWGEHQGLTQQWLSLAHTLHQAGNAREIAAPLSLLVDSFALPAEGFLTPEFELDDEVVVHPLHNGKLLNAISLPLAKLALLTRELTLPVEAGSLGNIDILDMPAAAPGANAPLWQTKCLWLLDSYRQQLQPDVLLVCNASVQRSQTPSIARTLVQWVTETQPMQESALPGLVWAITPQDHRFTRKQNLDEAVQQLIKHPGQRWGTLQALDSSSLQRLTEWLMQALNPTLRDARLQLIERELHGNARALLSQYLNPAHQDAATMQTQAENIVRQLQARAAVLGEMLEGLLPPLQAFEALCQAQQPREEKVAGLFSESVDLFAQPEDGALAAADDQDTGTLAHALWVRYLRQWSRRQEIAAQSGLSADVLHQLAESIIVTSYRLGLPARLQQVMRSENPSASQLRATIGNFIAWFDYAGMPAQTRPASRIAKGSPIFALKAPDTRARLTQLGEQPVHAATRYVYDWLVALYSRATENAGWQHPHDISPEARRQLQGYFS